MLRIRPSIARTMLAVLLLATSSALGQVAATGDAALGERFRPLTPIYDAQKNTPGMQRLLNERDDTLAALRESTGVAWWALFDEATRRPRLALAGGASVATGQIEDDESLITLARDFFAENEGFFRVPLEDLEFFRVRRFKNNRLVQFQQNVANVYAPQTFINVLFVQRPNELVLSRVGGNVFPDARVDFEIEIDEDQALEIAKNWIGPERVVQSDEIVFRVVAAPTADGKSVEPRLTYSLILDADLPFARYQLYVDVESGDVVACFDTVSYVDIEGSIQGWATPGNVADLSSNPETLQPLPFARIEIPGVGTQQADENGDFFFPHSGTAPVSGTVSLVSPWVNVNNEAGVDLTLTQSFTPGTSASFTLNPATAQFATSQLNGFIHTNRVHDYLKEIDPNFTDMDFTVPCDVNINDNCNAFYVAGTINFFRAGSGCANTCFSTVVHHEYGHGVVDAIFPFSVAGNFNEGIADVCACFLVDAPEVGDGFTGSGTWIRNVDSQDREYPGDLSLPIHSAGLIIGGSFWDTLQELEATLPAAEAMVLAREYYLMHMYFLTGQISPEITIDVLTIDDDDGNLLNGTPHYEQINAGFGEHGLPGPDLDFIEFIHTPLTDTEDDIFATEVTAVVNPNIAPAITAVQLAYSTGSGFSFVDMQPTGVLNEYNGFIPAVDSPAAVSYYLQATDSLGNVERFPSGAPTATYDYFIGIVTEAFFDEIGSTDGGWVHVEIQQQDDWQRGVPNQDGDNEWDPLVAFSPPRVWGNDLNPDGFNGDYQNDVHNWLESPSIDCTGLENVQLSFQRWLTVEEGIYDQAIVSVNGVEVWSNPSLGNTIDSSWTLQTFDISAIADDNPDVKVRFELISDAGLVFGGWNIDDIRVLSVAESNPSIFIATVEDAEGPAGGIVDVDIRARNDEPVESYRLAGTFDPAVLTVEEVAVTGTDVEALDPDLVLVNFDNTAGFYWAGVTIDLLGIETVPVSMDQSLLRVSFRADLGADGTTTDVTLEPEVAGVPGIQTDFGLVGVDVVVPQLESGTVTVAGIAGTPFVRGDANSDGTVDLTDAVNNLNYQFLPGSFTPDCLQSLDVNDDGEITVTDTVYVLNFLFQFGSPPLPPFPVAGLDPTPDGLGCDLP